MAQKITRDQRSIQAQQSRGPDLSGFQQAAANVGIMAAAAGQAASAYGNIGRQWQAIQQPMVQIGAEMAKQRGKDREVPEVALDPQTGFPAVMPESGFSLRIEEQVYQERVKAGYIAAWQTAYNEKAQKIAQDNAWNPVKQRDALQKLQGESQARIPAWASDTLNAYADDINSRFVRGTMESTWKQNIADGNLAIDKQVALGLSNALQGLSTSLGGDMDRAIMDTELGPGMNNDATPGTTAALSKNLGAARQWTMPQNVALVGLQIYRDASKELIIPGANPKLNQARIQAFRENFQNKLGDTLVNAMVWDEEEGKIVAKEVPISMALDGDAYSESIGTVVSRVVAALDNDNKRQAVLASVKVDGMVRDIAELSADAFLTENVGQRLLSVQDIQERIRDQARTLPTWMRQTFLQRSMAALNGEYGNYRMNASIASSHQELMRQYDFLSEMTQEQREEWAAGTGFQLGWWHDGNPGTQAGLTDEAFKTWVSTSGRTRKPTAAELALAEMGAYRSIIEESALKNFEGRYWEALDHHRLNGDLPTRPHTKVWMDASQTMAEQSGIGENRRYLPTETVEILGGLDPQTNPEVLLQRWRHAGTVLGVMPTEVSDTFAALGDIMSGQRFVKDGVYRSAVLDGVDRLMKGPGAIGRMLRKNIQKAGMMNPDLWLPIEYALANRHLIGETNPDEMVLTNISRLANGDDLLTVDTDKRNAIEAAVSGIEWQQGLLTYPGPRPWGWLESTVSDMYRPNLTNEGGQVDPFALQHIEDTAITLAKGKYSSLLGKEGGMQEVAEWAVHELGKLGHVGASPLLMTPREQLGGYERLKDGSIEMIWGVGMMPPELWIAQNMGIGGVQPDNVTELNSNFFLDRRHIEELPESLWNSTFIGSLVNHANNDLGLSFRDGRKFDAYDIGTTLKMRWSGRTDVSNGAPLYDLVLLSPDGPTKVSAIPWNPTVPVANYKALSITEKAQIDGVYTEGLDSMWKAFDVTTLGD